MRAKGALARDTLQTTYLATGPQPRYRPRAPVCYRSAMHIHSEPVKGRIQMTLWPRALLLSSLVIGVNAGDLPAQADPIQVSGGLVSGVAGGGVQTYKGIP